MIRKDDWRKFYVRQCENCGFVYLNPQPEWEELRRFYGGGYYMADDLPQNKQHSPFYNFLRKAKRAIFGAPNPKFWNFGGAKGKFLDIGCGNGAYESYVILNYPGWEFHGVEPNESSFRVAETVSGFQVFNGNLEDARYENNFFDAILMNHSLEHLPDPSAALKECQRILKPGGRLVIGVPNFNCPARRFFGSCWIHLDAPRHLFHFSAGVLSGMLKKAGFSVVSARFEILSGSIIRSIAYRFNINEFFFERPLIMQAVHWLIFPLNKLIEFLRLGSGLRAIATK
ncbi:MAG: class I SAM-dependent methyltransferase [Patescibacteria group bacterium]